MGSRRSTEEESIQASDLSRHRQLSDSPSFSSGASDSSFHHGALQGRKSEETDSSFLLGAGHGGREAEGGGRGESPSGCSGTFQLFWRFSQRFCQKLDIERRILWIISGPAVAGFVLLFCGSMSANQNVPRMLAALLWMAVWWLTEALPIAVTSLLPLFLFPFLQIMEASEVAKSYVNDTIVLFIGSFMLALCVEKYNVHKRIALKLLLLLRSKEKTMDPRLVILGFCLAPGFISMWINNTATAIMMVPMAVGVLHRVQSSRTTSLEKLEVSEEEIENCMEKMETSRVSKIKADSDEVLADKNCPDEMQADREAKIRVNLGNRGEGSTAVRVNNVKHYAEEISFQEEKNVWEKVSGETLDLERNDSEDSIQRDLERGFRKGGKGAENMATFEIETGKRSDVRWSEGQGIEECNQSCSEGQDSSEEYIQNFSKGVVLAIAYSASIGGMATIIGTGPNLVLAGVWRHLFPEAPPITFMDWFMFGAPLAFVFLLVLWAMLSFWYCPLPAVPLISASLDLRVMEEEYTQLGFSLSAAVAQSGLSAWIGDHMTVFQPLPPLLLVPSVSLLVVFCTEFSSNSATATIFLPLLAHVALSINRHPLLLLLPATCACSFAFMLPIATPPNAIAYATGYLRMRDMAVPGFVLNVVGIGLLTCFVLTLGE